VVDEQMNDVPRDGRTMGEVVMHGNIVMKGYFADPEATNAAFEGGWFHSGDLAVCHHDGYIELRDRMKDVIISGGENISTIEVEQVIDQHPAVMECAVIAIPDEKWGERPKAFVIVKPDQSASEAEIIAFCRERLAHFKCPATVEFGPLPSAQPPWSSAPCQGTRPAKYRSSCCVAKSGGSTTCVSIRAEALSSYCIPQRV
jgi:acyl-CoA synthetase (AMP-forming)/AMP-acid ligase II